MRSALEKFVENAFGGLALTFFGFTTGFEQVPKNLTKTVSLIAAVSSGSRLGRLLFAAIATAGLASAEHFINYATEATAGTLGVSSGAGIGFAARSRFALAL